MIILAATPIGNLGDASRRLMETLERAELVAAEDTRTAAQLLRGLGVTNRPTLIALHEHNEDARAAELVQRAAETDLVVLTDAGMPSISDPGFALVTAAIAAGVPVTVLPGPSAVLAALVLSGLPVDRFAFEGFVPRKGRAAYFEALAGERRTMVFFESPHRIADTLAALRDAFGADRPVAVCRELTKLHEEVVRGGAAELAERFADGARGELVIVAGGAPATAADPASALAQVLELVAGGARLKDACAEVASVTGLSSRELYAAALAAKG